MLKITIPAQEAYDEANNEFITIKEQTLTLEHSLVSIAKWESTWCVPFLDNENLTSEQLLDYVRCMTLTQNVDPKVYAFIPKSEFMKIVEYIKKPQTATTFTEDAFTKGKTGKKEIITSELIYYWMDIFHIAPERQKWPLSRLLTLIRIHSIKEAPPKKMSKAEILARNKRLNDERKKKYGTKG